MEQNMNKRRVWSIKNCSFVFFSILHFECVRRGEAFAQFHPLWAKEGFLLSFPPDGPLAVNALMCRWTNVPKWTTAPIQSAQFVQSNRETAWSLEPCRVKMSSSHCTEDLTQLWVTYYGPNFFLATSGHLVVSTQVHSNSAQVLVTSYSCLIAGLSYLSPAEMSWRNPEVFLWIVQFQYLSTRDRWIALNSAKRGQI